MRHKTVNIQLCMGVFNFLNKVYNYIKNQSNQYRDGYSNWESASRESSGYHQSEILEKVLDSTLKVKQGKAVFERDSVLFSEPNYQWNIVAGLLWAAAQCEGRLDVIDFGGALGSSFFQCLPIIKKLHTVKWSIVEQKKYVDVGREHVATDQLKFYYSIDECMCESTPNTILLSSVLQYVSDTESLLARINKIHASTLIVDRTPFHCGDDDKFCVQIVPDIIYRASYPMRILSEKRFLNALDQWQLVSRNVSQEGMVKTRSGFMMTFKAYLFIRKD
jgi:putative methyltransferase (TIGR04325 family)